MVEGSERSQKIDIASLVCADFFRDADLGYLQGLAMDIPYDHTTKIAKAVRGKFRITFQESKHARFSIRNRIEKLSDAGDYSAMVLAYIRAVDLGLIDVPDVGKPQEPLSADEKRVLALTAYAFRSQIVAERIGISVEDVNDHKDGIVRKFGKETIYPIIAKARKELRRKLEVQQQDV